MLPTFSSLKAVKTAVPLLPAVPGIRNKSKPEAPNLPVKGRAKTTDKRIFCLGFTEGFARISEDNRQEKNTNHTFYDRSVRS